MGPLLAMVMACTTVGWLTQSEIMVDGVRAVRELCHYFSACMKGHPQHTRYTNDKANVATQGFQSDQQVTCSRKGTTTNCIGDCSAKAAWTQQATIITSGV